MHGQISAKNKPDAVNLELLKNKNIDYLALGYYHSFIGTGTGQARRLLLQATAAWKARSYDEIGEKGFVLLDTQTLAPMKLVTGQATERFMK